MSTGSEIRYGDARREWSPIFVEYMTTIVEHPNYEGMPCTRDPAGKIDWTIPSNRKRGSKNWDGNARRRDWWTDKAQALGIATQGKWLSKVARANHPFGSKPCQPCGRVLEIAYAYPTSRTITRLNRFMPLAAQLAWEDLLPIEAIINHVFLTLGGAEAARELSLAFPLVEGSASAGDVALAIRREYCDKQSRMFSPGVMSNNPDRLDGFHTYNLCCREAQDRGRARDNLVTYTVDRRAYEHWCEGDWVVADRVMSAVAAEGACAQCQEVRPLTADHIGPISLGFAHSPYFRPLCGPCNSAKNNRMTLQDVRDLLELEARGDAVMSWHARPLWDAVKHEVTSDQQSLLLSKLLRINQHHYLSALYEAITVGVPEVLLQFLHPEHAGFRVDLVDFDDQALTLRDVRRSPRQDTYAHSRASRMMRIAYESLRLYASKPKRNIQRVEDGQVEEALEAYGVALRDAVPHASRERDALGAALESDESADARDAVLREGLPLGFQPPAFDAIRNVLTKLMEAYAVVLAERFDRGEAVAWDDLVDLE